MKPMGHDETRRDLLVGMTTVPLLFGGCKKESSGIEAASKARARKSEQEKADGLLLSKAADLEQGAILVYKAAAGLPFIKSDKLVITTAGRFLTQHQQHRDTMVKVAKQLGVSNVDPSRTKMPPLPKAILDATKPDAERKLAVLRFARKLEMQAARAYYVFVVRKLRTDFARKTAADVMPVEAQHVAVYDLLLKESTPAPTAFFSEQV